MGRQFPPPVIGYWQGQTLSHVETLSQTRIVALHCSLLLPLTKIHWGGGGGGGGYCLQWKWVMPAEPTQKRSTGLPLLHVDVEGVEAALESPSVCNINNSRNK